MARALSITSEWAVTQGRRNTATTNMCITNVSAIETQKINFFLLREVFGDSLVALEAFLAIS